MTVTIVTKSGTTKVVPNVRDLSVTENHVSWNTRNSYDKYALKDLESIDVNYPLDAMAEKLFEKAF